MRNRSQYGAVRLALLALFATFAILALTHVATTVDAAPPVGYIDADAQASVVQITADGKYVGSGVVITRDGLVATSSDVAMLALTKNSRGERIRLTIPSGMPRVAKVIDVDTKNGIGFIQMYGIIPPAARLARTAPKRNTALIYAVRDEDGTLRMEQKVGIEPDNAATAIFNRNTGELVAIHAHRLDGTTHVLTAADLRALIKSVTN